jgi:hypothetical protein
MTDHLVGNVKLTTSGILNCHGSALASLRLQFRPLCAERIKSGFNPWLKEYRVVGGGILLFDFALDHRFGRQGETTARQIDQQFQDAVDPAVNMLLC